MATAVGRPSPVNLRLSRAMLLRAEALQDIAAEAPELAILPSVTRSDVLRLAVLKGLEAIEREYEARVDAGLVQASDEAMEEEGEDVPLTVVRARLGL